MNARLIAAAWCVCASGALAQEATEPAKPKRSVPGVQLSAQHQQMVQVGVGTEFPALSLPSAAQPTDAAKPLVEQFGSKATVVAVVNGGSAMAKTLLRDLQLDIAAKYPSAEGEPATVATLAIATGTTPGAAIEQAARSKYDGPLLLDEQGTGFAELGTGRLPRVYVLNSAGQVAWFDIEYSLSTRRELKQAVRALARATAVE